MLKQIPKSDVSLRPFKVYKEFIATSFDSGSGFVASKAFNHTGSFDVLNTNEILENGIWHQLSTMYYRDPHNIYTSYGSIKPVYSDIEKIKQRILNNGAYVFQIPQIKFGEEIKPKSFILNSTLLNETMIDDGFGNLTSNYNSYEFIQIDIENGLFIFKDPNGSIHNAELVPSVDENGNSQTAIDIENGIFQIKNQDVFYLIKIDIETSFISWLGVFDPKNLDLIVSPVIIGNIFYSHGIVVITRDIDTNRKDIIDYDWEMTYKATNTIYENEILLIVDEDEFNVSTNPTALTEQNIETGSIVLSELTQYQIDARNINLNITDGGYVLYKDESGAEITLAVDQNTIYNFKAIEIVYNGLIGCSLQNFKQNIVKWRNSDKYQRTTTNQPYIGSDGISLAGFDIYDYSSSVDPTGSYLAPYITTIGLYDDNMDMVAVAKLATPIKSTPDLPVNFLVRFDT